ncbi:acyl carrier protein [Spongiactinospora sp. TRM90649]|uniref:acyl carrier protein n=1 Tax=Spongiactinospora sp. TRM90649 TaxID=3031114 RepID=UPI0023F81570|nr:acyl carrier protein [Spongiactinospora sp. TRM90649]MDF5755759.1 acyl carrier protein [Spongiactinospora sp. TRM90649]
MEIEDTITKILVTELFVETTTGRINPHESLRDRYGLDSLGFTELRVQCEDAFNVRIDDEYFVPENFRTVADLADLIRRLQGDDA